MNKPYREGTSALHIIVDGWSRGFKIEQTMQELKTMGYETDQKYVQIEWDVLNEKFEAEEGMKDG